MKQDKQKHNWIIDAALFGGFLGSLWLDLTGLAVHQWLGQSVGALATYHLIKHWSWVKAVTARFFGHTSSQSRTFYAVDAGLAIGFAAVTVTGVVISTWLDLALASYGAWYIVHVAASVATLGLLVAKIGLHWRWIVSVARRSIFPAPTASGRAIAPQPVAAQLVAGPQRAAASQVNRRDFVRLMAGVSAVALLAGANALGGMAGDQAEASASAVSTSAASTTSTRSTSSSTGTSSSCSVRCNRRCSYPGHCRKYTDSNDNGRCDLGECLS